MPFVIRVPSTTGAPLPPPPGGSNYPAVNAYSYVVADDYESGFRNGNYGSAGMPTPPGYVEDFSKPKYWGIYSEPGSHVKAVTLSSGAKVLQFYATRDATNLPPDPNGRRVRASAIVLTPQGTSPSSTFQDAVFMRFRVRIPVNSPIESDVGQNRHNWVEWKGKNGAGIQPFSVMRQGEQLYIWRYWSFDPIRDSVETPPPNGGYDIYPTGVGIAQFRVASNNPLDWPVLGILYRPGLGTDATIKLYVNHVLVATRAGPNHFAGYSNTEDSSYAQLDFHHWPWNDGPSESATRTLEIDDMELYKVSRTWNQFG